jgi:hypothetical protein
VNFWWLHALAETGKQKFSVVVHITWERGSIYFDDIKIWEPVMAEYKNRDKRDRSIHQRLSTCDEW